MKSNQIATSMNSFMQHSTLLQRQFATLSHTYQYKPCGCHEND